MSHLDNLTGCPLHRRTVFGITGVRHSQFSIAYYYGGVSFNGEHYTYLRDTDELIRDDVLKWAKKRGRITIGKWWDEPVKS